MNLRTWMGCLVVALLTACGGGDDTGGGGGPPAGGGGTLSLSTSSLAFNTLGSLTTPPAQQVIATVSGNISASVLYIRVVVAGPAVATVSGITITGNTGSGNVTPASAQALGPGTYTSTITVTACTSGPDCTSGVIGTPQTINVTYTVNGLRTSAISLDYTLRLSNAPADYTRSFTVRGYPGVALGSTVPWLTVTPAAGVPGTDTTVTASLTPALVDSLDSGTYSGVINMDLGLTGLPPAPINVTLTIAKPQLDQVTPYVALANQAGTVILRGSHLDQLPSSGIDLVPEAGGTAVAPASVSVMGPTELRIAHPALASGAYRVRMRDAQGTVIDRSKARLYAYAPSAFGATTLPYPAAAQHAVRQLLFDPERNALWVVMDHPGSGFEATQVLRYTWSGGAWSGPAIVRTGTLAGMTLSANGQTMYLSSRAATQNGSYALNDLVLADPFTLQQRSVLHPASTGTDFRTLAYASNGDLFAMESSRELSSVWSLYRLEARAGTLAREPGDTFNQSSAPGFQHGLVAGSADGSRLLFADDNSADLRLFEYNAGTNTAFVAQPPRRLSSAMLNRNGSRALLGEYSGNLELFDRDWQLLGQLPTKYYPGTGPTPTTTREAILAPDGTTAYTYTWGGELRRFDLTLPAVNGLLQPDADPVPLGASPNSTDYGVAMAMTPDGRTLFIAGDVQVVVVPLP